MVSTPVPVAAMSNDNSVPADYASVKIQDAVLTRLSNDDSIERSLSTFAQEMATSAMILGNYELVLVVIQHLIASDRCQVWPLETLWFFLTRSVRSGRAGHT